MIWVMVVPNYKKMYLLLFNAITDALEAMERQNYRQAVETLIFAQRRAEALYMDAPPD